MNRATATTKISAPPAAVWSLVSDGNRLPEWPTPISQVRSVEDAGVLSDGSTVKVKMVGNVPPGQKVSVKEIVPGEKIRLVVGPAFAHALGIAMRVDLKLEPTEDGTLATVDFTCHPVAGPLQRRISGMNMAKHVRSTTQHLKEAAESAK